VTIHDRPDIIAVRCQRRPKENLTEGDAVSAKIRATILSSIVLTGAAIAFIGGAGETARAMESGNIGSAHHISVLADGLGSGPDFPGSGPTNTGFTWGGRI
jgi:hypothetical protein